MPEAMMKIGRETRGIWVQFETHSLPGFRNPSVRPLSLYVAAVHRPETASKDFPGKGEPETVPEA